MLGNALSALCLMKGWMNFNQTCTFISVEIQKNLLDFGVLDPIFKVTGGQRMLGNALSALCLMKGWMNFNQTFTFISVGDSKELIRFWCP